ncbi:hypothetical protein BC936DRAFT_142345 [Jimgerdemannia flammicorona]|uniref:Uncharacterized protein n=1 Tax=Jimgerdemannia flammicorona TaxID=994334 RepID=A0A433DFC4_9FUNG|nr:hypothetical protein BC936DRAFT_142345 [Jimgerdemannia flammicorona]
MGVIVFFGVIARRKLYGQKTLSAYFLPAHTLSHSNTGSGFATRWTTRCPARPYQHVPDVAR